MIEILWIRCKGKRIYATSYHNTDPAFHFPRKAACWYVLIINTTTPKRKRSIYALYTLTSDRITSVSHWPLDYSLTVTIERSLLFMIQILSYSVSVGLLISIARKWMACSWDIYPDERWRARADSAFSCLEPRRLLRENQGAILRPRLAWVTKTSLREKVECQMSQRRLYDRADSL